MDSKMIALAVVTLVVIAGVGAFVLLKDDKKDDKTEYEALGLVYGNADGDCDIDQDDLDLIESLIGDDSKLKEYPLADTNCDGKISEADKTMAEKIKNKEKMDIFVIDDTGKAVSCHFPLTKIFTTGGTNSRVVSAVLNLEKFVVANSTNEKSLGDKLDKALYDLRKSGTITVVNSTPTDDDKTALTSVDFEAAVLEESGMSGYSASDFQDLYESKKASFLQFNYDNAERSLQSIATIGILVGSEEQAKKYIDFNNNVMQEIKDKIGGDFRSKTVMTVVMTNSVSGNTKDYYKASEMSGGKNLADFPENRKFPDGENKTWLLDPKYNPDYLIHTSSAVFGKDPSSTTVKAIKSNFSQTAAYKAGDYYLINGVMPLPARLAYMAEIMYGEQVGEGYGASVLQTYLDNYIPGGLQAKDFKVMWNTEELGKL